jgi:hypothetical protein
MTISEKRYLTIAESNKLLRKHLARAFPGVKFSVRGESYAGGSSTDVRWVDGPLLSQVEAIAKPYAYKGFDGMIDMQYSYAQWLLPDGTVCVAGTDGTEGSRGVVPGFKVERPAGAVPISTGIGFISCTRKTSPEMYKRALAAVLRRYGEEPLNLDEAVRVSEYDGSASLASRFDVRIADADEYLSTLIYRDLVKRTGYLGAAGDDYRAAKDGAKGGGS